MAKFCEITWADMHAFMVENGLKLLNPPRRLPDFVKSEECAKVRPDLGRTVELVYAKRVYMQGSDRQLSLRVYTTITPYEGASREKGSDAIRVVLFWREVEVQGDTEVGLEPRLIGGERRVHRVMGWRKNLGDRLANWPTFLGPECPQCHRPMAERDVKRGKFWGCTGYPRCKCIINIGEGDNPVCEKCNKPMKKRSGPHGEFWGCTGYPACKNTRKVA